MVCDSCGNKKAHIFRCSASGMGCDKCMSIKQPWVPDVYFKEPYLDPNLGRAERPHEKEGVWVTSRRHKESLLREQGLRERGDKVHGGRNYDRNIRTGREE